MEASDAPVGLLEGEGARVSFTYLAEYLGQDGALPLSMSLPLQEAPYGDLPTRSYFENLLQENTELEAVLRREGLDRDDLAGILAHTGKDCSGAVSVLPEGSEPVKKPGLINEHYDEISDDDIVDIVRRLARQQSVLADRPDPSPLAGVQRKIAVTLLESGRFAFPRPGTGAPTTHILKVPDTGPHEALQEHLSAQLSNHADIPVVMSDLLDVDGIQALLIPRYDRSVTESGEIRRVHQEDFAQALGLPAAAKYERRPYGQLRFDAAAIRRVLDNTAEPVLARQTFIDLTLFNLLIGNSDNHAKNHSLLYIGTTPELAPAYDLVPTCLNNQVVDDLAFRIGTALKPDEVTVDCLVEFAVTLGLSETGALSVIKQAVRKVIDTLEAATLSSPFTSGSEALANRRWDHLIGEMCALLNTELDLGLEVRERDTFVTRGGGWSMS